MRVTIQHSLKIPAGQEYSSRQHSVAMEMDVPDDVVQKGKDAIRDYVSAVAKEVRAYVEDELRKSDDEPRLVRERSDARSALASLAPRRAPPSIVRGVASQNSRAMPHNDDGLASPKQLNFLRSLGSQNGMSYGQVAGLAEETFGKRDLRELTKKEASSLIDQLRSEAA